MKYFGELVNGVIQIELQTKKINIYISIFFFLLGFRKDKEDDIMHASERRFMG